jgi:hypothetical protein
MPAASVLQGSLRVKRKRMTPQKEDRFCAATRMKQHAQFHESTKKKRCWISIQQRFRLGT